MIYVCFSLLPIFFYSYFSCLLQLQKVKNFCYLAQNQLPATHSSVDLELIVLGLPKSLKKARYKVSAFERNSFSLFQLEESRSNTLLSQVQVHKLSNLVFPSSQDLHVLTLLQTCFTHSLDPTNQENFDDQRINYFLPPHKVDTSHSINERVPLRNYKVHNVCYYKIGKGLLDKHGAQPPLHCILYQHQCELECVFLIHLTFLKIICLSLFDQAD